MASAAGCYTAIKNEMGYDYCTSPLYIPFKCRGKVSIPGREIKWRKAGERIGGKGFFHAFVSCGLPESGGRESCPK